jgi:hypothetical protein
MEEAETPQDVPARTLTSSVNALPTNLLRSNSAGSPDHPQERD